VIDMDYVELFLEYLELAIYYPYMLDRETADVQITMNLTPYILRNFSDIQDLWYHRECGNCGETLRVKYDGICDCHIGDEWRGPGCYICQRVTDRDTCLDFCGHCYQTKEGRVRCRECPNYYIREYWGITRDEISERSQHVWPNFEL
ncbi:MAG: hypothetical protein KDA77_20595, partial [Planctomycetaceae bacterium]|nr:hypothetical protein [Planctomycetaceae bacterium]